jgi:hypothetical protein
MPTTMLYAVIIIKTSMLFLNDRRLEVRTACERRPTSDTPTANPNTDQVNIWSTPVTSFLIRCDIVIWIGARCAQKCNDMRSTNRSAKPTEV